MKRKIIHIDEAKCNGCGLCAAACHEGAIGMIDGKAKLLRDDYCDGLGDCLPVCPTNAIKFTEREAAAYDHEAVQKNIYKKNEVIEREPRKNEVIEREPRKNEVIEREPHAEPLPCGCPGTHSKRIMRGAEISHNTDCTGTHLQTIANDDNTDNQSLREPMSSELSQWPVQIKLVPVNAPYFNAARLLVAADCTAFAYCNFHRDFIKGRVTLIGCPKLDEGDYTEKLTEIIRTNDIKDVTVVRMEVPCCGGIEHAVKLALQNSGKFIPWQVVTISVDGKVLR